MRTIITTILIFMTMSIAGQKIYTLREQSVFGNIPSGKAVIYGNFIQRLGFSSGGFPQEIRILNIESNELFTFNVKPTFKSTKENLFCYTLNPGIYIIYIYFWTKSTVYGGKMYYEPIYKGVDSNDNLEEKVKTGFIKKEDLVHFTFTISENSLNYMGTWHFDTGIVYFSEDKETADSKFTRKYKKIDFTKSIVTLPK